jgi:hypothetical protein
MKTKLHKHIIKDKKVSASRVKHHRNIEKEYEELKREVEQLKHRKGADKAYHTKRLHKKAHKLHAKAVKHEHPTLISRIGGVATALGQTIRKGYEGYKKDYAQKQLANKIERERLQKVEEEKKVEVQKLKQEGIETYY